MGVAQEISQKIVALDESAVKELLEKALREGENPLSILEALRQALSEVGRLYEEKTYFLSDLILAAGISQLVIQTLTPYLMATPEKKRGKVVIGTVEGSLHDMGKSIVIALLLANGYQVHDLGVNVPAERFIEKLRETGAPILGLSVGLVQALPSVGKVVTSLKNAVLRDKVKVILGGNAATQERAMNLGCDAYAPSATEGIRIINSWAVA
jgi:methanogenic corrinoid protein MtbC1